MTLVCVVSTQPSARKEPNRTETHPPLIQGYFYPRPSAGCRRNNFNFLGCRSSQLYLAGGMTVCEVYPSGCSTLMLLLIWNDTWAILLLPAALRFAALQRECGRRIWDDLCRKGRKATLILV